VPLRRCVCARLVDAEILEVNTIDFIPFHAYSPEYFSIYSEYRLTV